VRHWRLEAPSRVTGEGVTNHMSHIRNQSAPVNGGATVSEQKLQDFDDRYGDLIRDPGWLAWAKSQFREVAVADTWPRQAGLRILIIIIERFNGAKGYAWPSYDELAGCTLLNRSTAIRWVARLERLGWIFIKARSTGRGNTNELVLNFDRIADAIAEKEKAEKEKGVRRKGGRCGGLKTERVAEGGCSLPETGTSATPTTTPTRSENGVLEWTDAGRSPADAGRARAGEAAPDLFERLWALPWPDKSFKARNAAKRAVAATKARADAPPDDLLVAKAESYLAHVPRAEQRWLSVWLRDEGWLCDESPPKPDRASKANGKAAPQGSIAARFPVGTRVRDTHNGDCGRVVEQCPPRKEYGEADEPVRIVWDDGVDEWYREKDLRAFEVVVGSGEADPDEFYDPDRDETVQQFAARRGFAVGVKVRQDNEGLDEDEWKDENEIGEVIGIDDHVEVKWPSKQGTSSYDGCGLNCLLAVS
jgi:helix-turn-helix protein